MGIITAIGEAIATVITSPVFIVLAAIALAVLGVWGLYVRCKLYAMGRMEYIRSFSADGIFSGESLELTESIHNTTLFPLFFVRMEFFVPGGFTVDGMECKTHTKVVSIFHVPPYSTASKTHVLRGDIRGRYSLVNTTAVYRDNEFLFEHPFDIYVYPRYDAAEDVGDERLYTVGDSIAGRKYREDPFFVSGIRPYIAGDPLRSINFKASARSVRGGRTELLCNSYDSSRDYDSMIFLDLFARSEHGRTVDEAALLENGLELACRLTVETVRSGGTVGFAANCAVGSRDHVHVPVSSGEAHTRELLRCMAQLSSYSRCTCSMERLLTRVTPGLSRRTDIYLIAHSVDIATSQLIRRIERTGRTVTVIPLSEGGWEREHEHA